MRSTALAYVPADKKVWSVASGGTSSLTTWAWQIYGDRYFNGQKRCYIEFMASISDKITTQSLKN